MIVLINNHTCEKTLCILYAILKFKGWYGSGFLWYKLGFFLFKCLVGLVWYIVLLTVTSANVLMDGNISLINRRTA